MSKVISIHNKKVIPKHVEFMDKFISFYETKTRSKYKADKKDWVLIHRLVRDFGIQEVIGKVRLLDTLIKTGKYPWNLGYYHMTIGTLSSRWNQIIEGSSNGKSIGLNQSEVSDFLGS